MWVGLTSLRPNTFNPAASIHDKSSARVLKPKCSARSDKINQPSPSGERWSFKPAKKPLSIWLSGSYTAYSIGELGLAGTQGGLQMINGAVPSGKRLVCINLTCLPIPKPSMFSVAHSIARSSWSVATIFWMPRLANTAAKTPVPVPISNANDCLLMEAGKGAFSSKPMYS